MKPTHIEATYDMSLMEPYPDDQPETPLECAWTIDDWGGDSVHETQCGHTFEFTNGGPDENGITFCGYCGKRLREVFTSELKGHSSPPNRILSVPDIRPRTVGVRAMSDMPKWYITGGRTEHGNTIRDDRRVPPLVTHGADIVKALANSGITVWSEEKYRELEKDPEIAASLYDPSWTDWQPIDTAPKDGTRILAWNPRWDTPVVVWWEMSYRRGSEGHHWHDVHGVLELDAEPDSPTHWLRYPEPPKESDAT